MDGSLIFKDAENWFDKSTIAYFLAIEQKLKFVLELSHHR